jgi:hypothetical protein
MPPVCDVFDDSVYIGKSNIQLLYFKSGKRQVKFKKGKLEKNLEMKLNDGVNKSILVKLNE